MEVNEGGNSSRNCLLSSFEKFSHYELWFGLWLTPYDKESSGNYCAFSSILRDIRNIRLLGINLVGGRVFHKSPKIQPTPFFFILWEIGIGSKPESDGQG